MAVAVSIRDVGKRYRRGKLSVEILNHFSLEIAAGEFLAIMAPSGSGKSTLLNLVGGLDRPDSGEIVVAGERIDKMSSRALARWRARNIGFVFQFYNLMPALSAWRNVELPLLLKPLSAGERKRRVGVALEIVELTNRAGHKPGQMSGGEQQRVAIARALVSDPTLLLCDEPTGDLDRAAADDTLGLLKTLSTEHKKTIVLVTHDQRAADYAGRQIKLDKQMLAVFRGAAP